MQPVVPPLDEALRGAVETAKYQRFEVPELPDGWIVQTEKALDLADPVAMAASADQILAVHSQYRADFDVKGWLFDLRLARFHQPTETV
jgi:hypothetical protein